MNHSDYYFNICAFVAAPKVPDAIALKTYQTKDGIVLAPNERPSDLLAVLQYFDSANCPTPTGRTGKHPNRV